MRRLARRSGLQLTGEYSDVGVSGTTELADRPGLAALLDRIESNGVRVVIVERADRLARDLVVGELILGRFRAVGVRVLDAEGVELTAGDGDPTRKLIRQVLGAVAEFDRCVTVLKLRAARDRIRAREGRCEGRRAFGANPAEKKVLDRILELRRARRGQPRQSFEKIAAQLNLEGASTRTGVAWAPATVYKVVRRHRPGLAPGR
jgi:DNA invertase Pin-like site-specific DNA recombinase